jgi:hypothetical protein
MLVLEMLYPCMSFNALSVWVIAGVSYTPFVGEIRVSVEVTFENAVCSVWGTIWGQKQLSISGMGGWVWFSECFAMGELFHKVWGHLYCIYTDYKYRYLMFCWPCIVVYQYSETNVMLFLFNLLLKLHFIPGAANWHTTHALYQVPLMKRLLRMRKWCSKHVEALNS